jgi:hypothetical protein
MAVTINGTTGVAVPLGTAAAPGVVNTTSATTGIYNPASTTLALATNGTQAVYVDASQNVGIGTSSTGAGYRVSVVGSAASSVPLYLHSDATNGYVYSPNPLVVGSTGAYALSLVTNNTVQMTIASSGIVTGTAGNLMLVQGTAQASTSGTAINFTSVIPTWAKRVTMAFNGVSTGGTNNLIIQLGTGGTATITGYSAQTTGIASSSGATSSSTVGFPIYHNVATYAWSGVVTLQNVSGNIWVAGGVLGNATTTALSAFTSGVVTLAGALDTIRVIASATGAPSDTFDAGSINIQWE